MDSYSTGENNLSINKIKQHLASNKGLIVVVIIACIIVLALYIAFYYLIYKLIVKVIGGLLSPVPRSITAIGIIILGSMFFHKFCYDCVKDRIQTKSKPIAANNNDQVHYYIDKQPTDVYPYASFDNEFETLYT